MKKDPYKFTLHLNANDPRHVRAAEYLNSLGHKIGGTIVDALLFYMEQGVPAGASRTPALTRDQVRQMIYDILRQQGKVSERVHEDGSIPSEKSGTVGGQKAVEANAGRKTAENTTADTAPSEARQDGLEMLAENGEGSRKGVELDNAALNQIADALKMFGEM